MTGKALRISICFLKSLVLKVYRNNDKSTLGIVHNAITLWLKVIDVASTRQIIIEMDNPIQIILARGENITF